jgi:hypothetical protein
MTSKSFPDHQQKNSQQMEEAKSGSTIKHA